jgi:hypothetical protein
VLIERRAQQGIRDGSITVLLRRWRQRQATAGHVYRTAAGMIGVSSIEEVNPASLAEADARAAGYPDADAARADLRGDPATPVYLMRIHPVTEPDPRTVLASAANLSAADVQAITTRLDRLDAAGSWGPWTRPTLAAIESRPGVRAPDLAASFGRETAPFKADVRKLKNLGLTSSLPVGYELSPRGIAYLAVTRKP